RASPPSLSAWCSPTPTDSCKPPRAVNEGRMANETLPFIAFNFEIQLIVPNAAGMGLASQLCNGEFAECDGLEMSMEPKKVSEGGNNLQQIHLVGPVSYG